MPRRPRAPADAARTSTGALALVVVLAVALGGCGDRGTDKIPAAASLSIGPVPTTSTTAPAIPATTAPPGAVHAVGEQVSTAGGNLLQVVAYDPAAGPGRVAAEVDGCSSPSAPARLGSDTFFLELADGRELVAVPGGKQPELTAIDLEPNTCGRGWVTFELPEGAVPVHVVFRGSSLVRWSVR